MRPARIIAVVVLAAAVAATGSYIALSTAHPSAAAPAATQSSATTPVPTPISTVPPATYLPTPPPSPPGACRTAQLHLQTGQIEGAMGQRFITYGLRNRSAVACTLFGFPGVHLLDAHGGVLPTVVGHGYFDTGPATRVLLRPGGWAFFTLQEGVNPYDTDPQPCPTVTLAITPPNQHQALTVPEAIAPCGGRVSVSPIRSTGELTPIR